MLYPLWWFAWAALYFDAYPSFYPLRLEWTGRVGDWALPGATLALSSLLWHFKRPRDPAYAWKRRPPLDSEPASYRTAGPLVATLDPRVAARAARVFVGRIAVGLAGFYYAQFCVPNKPSLPPSFRESYNPNEPMLGLCGTFVPETVNFWRYLLVLGLWQLVLLWHAPFRRRLFGRLPVTLGR